MLGTINSGGAKPQDLSGYLKTDQLGKAGGVAPLDEQAKIILDYLYTNAANALAKLDATGKLPTDLIPTLSAYIAATAKGAANGVASLDATGKLPSGQMTAHGHAYSDITDKPSTFPPASHSHAASEISGLATYLAGQGYGKVATGTYVGTGSERTITLPFAPAVVFVSTVNEATAFTPAIPQGFTGVFSSLITSKSISIALSGSSLTVSNAINYADETYRWLAFA